jgi:hypothetical protein
MRREPQRKNGCCGENEKAEIKKHNRRVRGGMRREPQRENSYCGENEKEEIKIHNRRVRGVCAENRK